jgi:hypothetical protein
MKLGIEVWTGFFGVVQRGVSTDGVRGVALTYRLTVSRRSADVSTSVMRRGVRPLSSHVATGSTPWADLQSTADRLHVVRGLWSCTLVIRRVPAPPRWHSAEQPRERCPAVSVDNTPYQRVRCGRNGQSVTSADVLPAGTRSGAVVVAR